MPFTFAHPAAVLPFKKMCPSFLSMPALVVGAMAPDAPYFVHAWNIGADAHTLVRVFVVDLPISVVLLVGYLLLREPIARLLPTPHEQFWSSQSANISDFKSPTGVARILLSIVVGVLTHLAWDSCTHSHGLVVASIPSLAEPLPGVSAIPLPVFKLLQYASSILGLGIILFYYLRALPPVAAKSEDDKKKWWTLIVLLLVAVVVGCTMANPLRLALDAAGTELIRRVGFLCLVNSIGIFGFLLVVAALLKLIKTKNTP